jgi:hypothetical protein
MGCFALGRGMFRRHAASSVPVVIVGLTSCLNLNLMSLGDS